MIATHVAPNISSPDLPALPPNAITENRNGWPMCSRDGIMQEDNIVGYFPGQTDAWHPKLTPHDAEGFTARYRYLSVTQRSGDMGAALLEGEIRFLKDAKITQIGAGPCLPHQLPRATATTSPSTPLRRKPAGWPTPHSSTPREPRSQAVT